MAVTTIDNAASRMSKAPADILTSHAGLQRLKHESQSQWKERILSIERVNSIKEDNTITVATTFEKASRKAKRQQAREGKKHKGSKTKTSAYNTHQNVNERQSQDAAMAISLKDRLAAYQNRQGTEEVVNKVDDSDDEKYDKDCCIPQSSVVRATILVKLHQQVDQKKIDTSTATTTQPFVRKNSKGKDAAQSMSLSERLTAYQKKGGGGVCEDDHTISTSSSMSNESSQESRSSSDIKERTAKLQRCNSSINNDPMSKQRQDGSKEAASSISLRDRVEAYQNHQERDDDNQEEKKWIILQHDSSQRSAVQQQQTKVESTTNNILLQSRTREVDAATSVSLKERMLAYQQGVASAHENEDDEVHKQKDQNSQNKKNVTSEEEEDEEEAAKREVDLWFQRKQDKRSASYRAAAIAMKEEMNNTEPLHDIVSEQQFEAVDVPARRRRKKKNILLAFLHRFRRENNKKKTKKGL